MTPAWHEAGFDLQAIAGVVDALVPAPDVPTSRNPRRCTSRGLYRLAPRWKMDAMIGWQDGDGR